MSQIYEKWRDLTVNFDEIKFKNIHLKEIISYPPAGNDVIEAEIIYNNKKVTSFIKYERSKMADFDSEYYNITLLHDNKLYKKIPTIYEFGSFNNKKYIVMEKIDGERISDLLKSIDKYDYLFKYGKELAIIHNINSKYFRKAKQRIINDYPKIDNYKEFDEFIGKYIKYLCENKPEITYNTFIHGDFHYANILWDNDQINGVIDFEYSGLGFREQDIAWSIILRPTQKFMKSRKDILTFLKGYKSISNYDSDKLKWCLINGYCHFYLMNIKNTKYINKLKKLIEFVYECF